jgi:hypothetical protein
MTDPEREDAFEAFLKRRTLLPEASVDHKLEPPATLDALILNQARQAIQARRRPDRTPRWAIPVALAATILLCLSVVLNVSLNTHRAAPEQERMAAATADSAREAAPAPQADAANQPAPNAAPARAVAPPAPPPNFTPSLASRSADAKRKVDAQGAVSHQQDPKTWLEQIDALRAAGKTTQADAEMRRFRAVFPAYPANPAAPAPSEPAK